MKVIIEHLDLEIYEWSLMEYKHISSFVDDLLFTNVKNGGEKLKGLGEVKKESVKEMELKNACLLDPKAETLLSPDDKFEVFIFGGVLGNHPMDGRTAKELSNLKCEKRNLGKVQMSTDTAVLVVKRINDGVKFSDLEFKDGLSIEISDDFFNDLPYRYLVENGEVVLPPGFVEFLKKQEDNLD